MPSSQINKKKSKMAARDIVAKDYISHIPDELIIIILSLLPTDLAARSSIFSPRWQNVWKYSQVLDFDWECNNLLLSSKVSQALNLYQGLTCRVLRIRLSYLDEQADDHVANWFQFADRKSIERMELYLALPPHTYNHPQPRFELPMDTFSAANSFRYLCLHSTSVDDGNLEYIFKNCLKLEELRLLGSHNVKNLKICSVTLKKLEVLSCFNIRTLLLNTINLVSFEYAGPDIDISFVQAPLLVEVSFLGLYYCHSLLIREFEQFSPVLEQIQMIKLTMDHTWILGCPLVVDKLRNVKYLELNLKFRSYQRNYTLSMVDTLPSLNKLKLHLFWAKDFEPYGEIYLDNDHDHRHSCLRVVELGGFIGGVVDVQIAEYLIYKAMWLETLRIHVCEEECTEDPKDIMEDEAKEKARKLAYDLGAIIQPHTQLVVV